MFDPVTLDQLRAFVAVVEEGSFSAAARKLKRVQSAISASMANLEDQLDVPLWDRSGKVPKLTEQGERALAAARRVLVEVESFKRVTAGMASGLEAQVSLCVDALFPLAALVDLCGKFAAMFPEVDLRVDTQLMSAVSARVLAGTASIGVVAAPGLAPGLERARVGTVRMVGVIGPGHALAKAGKPITVAMLADAVQIVLSERSEEGTADQGVVSPRTWRVADLHTKHALILGGLGWGGMPESMVRADLRAGRLVPVQLDGGREALEVDLYAIHRQGATFGKAHAWLAEHLVTFCTRDTEGKAAAKSKVSKS